MEAPYGESLSKGPSNVSLGNWLLALGHHYSQCQSLVLESNIHYNIMLVLIVAIKKEGLEFSIVFKKATTLYYLLSPSCIVMQEPSLALARHSFLWGQALTVLGNSLGDKPSLYKGITWYILLLSLPRLLTSPSHQPPGADQCWAGIVP